MIIQVHKATSIPNTLANYIFGEKQEKEKEVWSRNIDCKGERCTQGDFIRSIEPLLRSNKSTYKNLMFHASVNPAEGEDISSEEIKEFIDDYMAIMGYQDQPYFVVKHDEKGRVHYHIASCRIDKNGKKIKDSWEKYKTKRFKDRYSFYQSLDNRRYANIKEEIESTISLALEYRIRNINDYIKILSAFGVEANVGEIMGKEGVSYRFKDLTRAIAHSELNIPNYRAVLEKFDQHNKEEEKRFKRRISNIAGFAIKVATSQKHFEKILSNKRIDILLNINKDNKVTGVYYIDHQTKSIFRGSEIGKEFAANSIDELCSSWLHKETSQNSNKPEDFDLVSDFIDDAMSGGGKNALSDYYEEERIKRKKKKLKKLQKGGNA